jgi:hypothetical protein
MPQYLEVYISDDLQNGIALQVVQLYTIKSVPQDLDHIGFHPAREQDPKLI